MSKFAVLRIEDDSDGDTVENVVKGNVQKKKKSRPHGKKKPVTVVDQDGFTLTTTSEEKVRQATEPVMIVYGKQNAQRKPGEVFERAAKSAEEDDDRQFQEVMKMSMQEAKAQKQRADAEEKQVQMATQASLKDAKAGSKKERSKTKSTSEHESGANAVPASSAVQTPTEPTEIDQPVDSVTLDLLRAADVEAKQLLQERFDHQLQASEMKITMVFRKKLKEAMKEIEALTVDRNSTAIEAKKYKDRYKKLCELLKDAEVREKAQLLMEMEKVNKVNEELTSEITSLTIEVEQQRSRIHELEKIMEHHKTHAGSPTA